MAWHAIDRFRKVRVLGKQQQQLDGWLDQRVLSRRKADVLGLDAYELSDDDRSRLVMVGTADTWISQEIGAWTAAMRIVPTKNGNPAVAEVRMFPREPAETRKASGLAPDEWSGCFKGIEAAVPGAGITARLLREVQIGLAVRNATDYLRKVFDTTPTLPWGWQAKVWPRRPASRGKRGGRTRIPDERLVLLAGTYAENFGARNPVQLAALACGITGTQARDWLHIARERRLLCPADIPGHLAS